MTQRRRTHASVLAVVAALAAVALLWPSWLAAAQTSDPEVEREGLRRRQADLAAELDVLRASDAEIADALAALNANLSTQLDRVTEAQRALARARTASAEAEGRVVTAQRKVDELTVRLRDMAIGLYVRPPLDDIVTAVVNAHPNDAPHRLALARFRVEDVTDVLGQSKAARTALQGAQRLALEASLEAGRREQAERARLAELEAARAQQQAFAEDVAERIERAMGEIGHLESLDAELTAEIQRRQLELAALLGGRTVVVEPAPSSELPPATSDSVPAPAGTTEATPVASPPATGGPDHTDEAAPTTAAPPPPTTAAPAPTTTRPPRVITITPVATEWVGGIEVAQAIAGQVRALLNAAAADGLTLTGSGYRNILDQIEIRRQVCGPTDYDIYDKPSWECSPPVARPGFSMHEKGLAIDFTAGNDLMRTQSSPAFQWLSANAARFGLYNLPSEPWHWSTTGR